MKTIKYFFVSIAHKMLSLISDMKDEQIFISRVDEINGYAGRKLKEYADKDTEIRIWNRIEIEDNKVNLYIQTEGVIYPLWYDSIVVDIYSPNRFNTVDEYLKNKPKHG